MVGNGDGRTCGRIAAPLRWVLRGVYTCHAARGSWRFSKVLKHAAPS